MKSSTVKHQLKKLQTFNSPHALKVLEQQLKKWTPSWLYMLHDNFESIFCCSRCDIKPIHSGWTGWDYPRAYPHHEEREPQALSHSWECHGTLLGAHVPELTCCLLFLPCKLSLSSLWTYISVGLLFNYESQNNIFFMNLYKLYFIKFI